MREETPMRTLSREALSRIRGRVRSYTHIEADRGAVTLEQVLWTAGIGVAAVAVIAVVVTIINTYTAQIPTGL